MTSVASGAQADNPYQTGPWKRPVELPILVQRRRRIPGQEMLGRTKILAHGKLIAVDYTASRSAGFGRSATVMALLDPDGRQPIPAA